MTPDPHTAVVVGSVHDCLLLFQQLKGIVAYGRIRHEDLAPAVPVSHARRNIAQETET